MFFLCFLKVCFQNVTSSNLLFKVIHYTVWQTFLTLFWSWMVFHKHSSFASWAVVIGQKRNVAVPFLQLEVHVHICCTRECKILFLWIYTCIPKIFTVGLIQCPVKLMERFIDFNQYSYSKAQLLECSLKASIRGNMANLYSLKNSNTT